MSFIKRMKIIAGDIIDFMDAKRKKDYDGKGEWTGANAQDHLKFMKAVAKALSKKGWKPEEPKQGSDVIDVWSKDRKLGFIEMTCTFCAINPKLGSMNGVFSWGKFDGTEDNYDVEVNMNQRGDIDIVQLDSALDESYRDVKTSKKAKKA